MVGSHLKLSDCSLEEHANYLICVVNLGGRAEKFLEMQQKEKKMQAFIDNFEAMHSEHETAAQSIQQNIVHLQECVSHVCFSVLHMFLFPWSLYTTEWIANVHQTCSATPMHTGNRGMFIALLVLFSNCRGSQDNRQAKPSMELIH